MGEMHDQSDAQLLRDYAERGAEAAFAKIVARHTDLVYSAALRQVYSPDLARDVTQSVFTDLARKARTVSANLSPEASLVGWLYRGTRFAARDLHRNETRRTQRERQAMDQFLSAPETAPDWEQLRPVLDDAMSELDDTDRDAVLLRYFKNHDLRTVGATLGISDDAAQKRVSRAVERLREFFAKRGVTVGASGLAVVISANAVQAAPVGLALTISTAAALTGTTLATAATVTATKAIAMTALQKTIVTATIAVLAGVGIYEAHQASQLRDRVQTLQQQQAPMAMQMEQLNQSLINATNQLAALRSDNERLNRNTGELLKLRNEVTQLRALRPEVVKLQKLATQSAFGLAEWKPSQLGNVGRETPQEALQTFFWSSVTTNIAEIRNSLIGDVSDPPTEAAIQEYVNRAANQQEFKGVAKIRVLSQSLSLADEVQMEVQLQFEQSSGQVNEGSGVSAMVTLLNINGEWKFVLNNTRDGDGNIIGVDLANKSSVR
ncbi:MAG: sigma-70 family RNA polymerase sigma factor [Verrucomicrobia bacterium]|nr:sigma-70 family RNA polymerase sigma factor [Verrucomicrobiota bacterium]